MTVSYYSSKSKHDVLPSSTVKDYFLLMKPRVMSLVVFTAISGMILAPGGIHPLLAFVSILSITIASGASAAINMWYDRDIDAIMQRTKKRPIVTGAIEPDEALSFGVIMAILSVFMMALCVNLLSAFLLLIAILYYVFIYTMWLKRTSIQNVVIGGVAGALPPMIGWSSVTNDISIGSLVLFAIIFIWTPPHSWALAIFRQEDYKNCNVPMMPAVKGVDYTKKQIVFYSILMIFTSFVPYFISMVNYIYLPTVSLLNIIFIFFLTRLFTTEVMGAARKLFYYSIIYLFIIFLSLILLSQFK